MGVVSRGLALVTMTENRTLELELVRVCKKELGTTFEANPDTKNVNISLCM